MRTLGFTLVTVAVLATGCWGPERVCNEGEYPARSIEYPDTGGVCVSDGANPPAGYERFPAGETPTYTHEQP